LFSLCIFTRQPTASSSSSLTKTTHIHNTHIHTGLASLSIYSSLSLSLSLSILSRFHHSFLAVLTKWLVSFWLGALGWCLSGLGPNTGVELQKNVFVAIISQANKRGTAGIGASFLSKKKKGQNKWREKGKMLCRILWMSAFFSVVCVSFRRLGGCWFWQRPS
jgi:hypothetical protein